MSRPSVRIENQYLSQGFQNIAGLDEAGKGAWAGPLVAAAVILPEKVRLPRLNDSKLLTEKKREELYELITRKALAWGVGIEDAYLIDEIGLAEAHRRTMRKAVQQLSIAADLLLVDGFGIKQLGVESICIVKGDQKVRCIAAASIIAKVTRDRLMNELHEQHPEYGFAEHKGYGTKQHQEALAEHGICPLHRLSYIPVFTQWQGDLFQYAK